MVAPFHSTNPKVSAEAEMDNTLNSIGWYAKEYKLSPEQVKLAFHTGLAAGKIWGQIIIPTKPERNQEINSASDHT